MNDQNNRQVIKLIYISGLLSIWSMAIVFFYFTQGSNILYLGALLNVFIIILTLWRPTSHAAWISFLISALIYIGTTYILSGANPPILITSVVSIAIFLMTAGLSALFRRQADIILEGFQYQGRIIEALSIYDKKTNLMKWSCAKKSLKSELLRSSRYHGELTLILFAIRHPSQFDQELRQKYEVTIANILKDVLRAEVDIPFIGKRVGLILPERDLAFSREFAYKIITMMQNNINAHISAGIANYPQDADTAQQLIDRAEEALQVALYTGLHVFMYQSLLKEKEKEHISFMEITQGTQEITKPVILRTERSPHEEYEKILRNIHLAADEWIVWLKGFEQLEDLYILADNPLAVDHIQHTEFLFTQPGHLVIKMQTSLNPLIDSGQPFPGWVIIKHNQKKHYLLISPL